MVQEVRLHHHCQNSECSAWRGPRPRSLADPVSEQFYSDEITEDAWAIYSEDFEKLGYRKYVP